MARQSGTVSATYTDRCLLAFTSPPLVGGNNEHAYLVAFTGEWVANPAARF
jgi:hypothetical protein